jgi:hypothetical protein
MGISAENGGDKAMDWMVHQVQEMCKYRSINKPTPLWGSILETSAASMERRANRKACCREI